MFWKITLLFFFNKIKVVTELFNILSAWKIIKGVFQTYMTNFQSYKLYSAMT
jgi:hypothetical protein